MRALDTLEERRLASPGLEPGQLPSEASLRDPRRAAVLSLVPGLGQLYNGETGKGLLFLAVTIANALTLGVIIFSPQLVAWMSQVAAGYNLQLDRDLVNTLAIFRPGSAAFLIYIGLLLSYISYAVREAYDHAVQRTQGTVYAKYFLGLSETTSGSYLFHFAVTAACIILVLFMVAPPKPPEQAIDIELVQPPPPPPEPERPKPAPKQETPKKVEAPKEPEPPKPVEPPPPQPNQVAVAIPTTDPAPLSLAPEGATTPETAAPAAGGQEGGNTQGGADGDSTEVDFGPYLQEMQRKIKKAWFPPKGNESKRITVKFKIKKSGSVRSIRLVESSGLSIADNAAIAAVEQAAPFGPLPAGADDEVTIKFTFDYNVFNSDSSSGVRRM